MKANQSPNQPIYTFKVNKSNQVKLDSIVDMRAQARTHGRTP